VGSESGPSRVRALVMQRTCPQLLRLLIERAGRPPDDEKPDKKMTDSWEELGLVSASPKLLRKGLEGVVMKQITAATKKGNEPGPNLLRNGFPHTVSALHEIRLTFGPSDRISIPALTESEVLCLFTADLSLPPPPQPPKSEPEAGPRRKRMDLCVLTFAERLQQYYRTRVRLSPDEVSRAKQRALDIATELEPTLWTPIAGEDTFLGHPQYCMLRRENLEYFPRGRSYWDRYLLGGYLSSRLVAEQLRKSVMESMNWPSLSGTLECEVRPVLGSPALKLEIGGLSERSDDDGERLFVSVLPTVRLGDMTLTAQPEITGSFDYVWYQSLYTSETARLAGLDQSGGGSEVRRKCLKTLKAVCRNCPALHKLTGSQLGNVILHMSEKESEWPESAFADRFQQAITEMIGYLEMGVLPSYFKPAVNLLQGFTEDDIDEMGFMLYCAVSEPEILLI
ncbi:hypothetical protein NFI96_006774, partial [Prochilodus magdalenae]